MAKKSMVEREKKRITLTKKYAFKRQALLEEYNKTSDFNLKLEIHSKIQSLPRNSSKIRIRNRCWKTGRPQVFIEILVYHVMFYVKWLTNVYCQGLLNQVGKLPNYFNKFHI